MALRPYSADGAQGAAQLSSAKADSSSAGSPSQSLTLPTSDPIDGVHRNMSFHSGNLSRFPLATLPTPSPKSPKFNVLSALIPHRRKKLPNTHDVGQALEKLNKLAKKTHKQHQNVLNIFKAWGTGLPDSASRELVMNLFNMLLGPLNISKDLSAKLARIGSQLDELSLLEDHRAHLESELINTQKLYHRASYKRYPSYQLQSYQVTYDTFRNDFDEITLRYRNKLVIVLKQSLHLIFASMHDQGESELECASLGFRLLAAFDSEPKHVVQSSIYQPLQYYTPLLAPADDSTTSFVHDERTCVQCNHTVEEPEVKPCSGIKYKTSNEPASVKVKAPLSPGQARFARLSPRLSNDYSLNCNASHETSENTLGRKQSTLLSSAIFNNQKKNHDGSELGENGEYYRPLSNASIISPNPFT